VIGHELAHHHLWLAQDGDFLVADRLLSTIGTHPEADPSHVRCAHRYRLVTELFADRGAFVACESVPTAVAALVKLETGFAGVSGESYLRQAREVVGAARPPAEPGSHPETFLRARALEAWTVSGEAANAEIEGWLDTSTTLDALDVVAQRKTMALTRRLVADVLRRDRFRSEAVATHARQFFPDVVAAAAPDPGLDEALRAVAPHLREFFSYVLLDFAAVDPDLTDEAVPAAVVHARRIGLGPTFEALVPKELGLRPKAWATVLRRATELAPTERPT